MTTRIDADEQRSSIELGNAFAGNDGWAIGAAVLSANYLAALDWYEKGYNVVPQKAVDVKHPGVKWKGLQDRLATPNEVTGGSTCLRMASASSPARSAASL